MRDIDPTASEYITSGYLRPEGRRYDIGSIIGVGSSLLGGFMGDDAASDAADAQSASAQAGIAEQRRQFDAIQKLLSPYVNTGTDGLNGQRVLLGLGALPQNNTGAAGNAVDYAALRSELLPQFTKAGPAIKGWVDNFGGGPEGDAGYWTTIPGTNTVDETGLAAAIQQRMAAQPAAIAPTGPSAMDQQASAISALENSPYFQAVNRQGEDALLQNAAATGGLRGGGIQAALSQFRPQLLQGLIDQQYSRLGGLSSLGQNAAAGVGNAGMSTGNSISDLLGQQGAAQAGASIAGGNAWGGALSGINTAYGKWAAQNPFANIQTNYGGNMGANALIPGF